MQSSTQAASPLLRCAKCTDTEPRGKVRGHATGICSDLSAAASTVEGLLCTMALALPSSEPGCSLSSAAGRSSSCSVSSMLLCWSYFLHLALQHQHQGSEHDHHVSVGPAKRCCHIRQGRGLADESKTLCYNQSINCISCPWDPTGVLNRQCLT